MPENRHRVALLADSHGFLDPRVERIALTAGLVIHAGDIGGKFILDALGSAGGEVVAIAGNNDTETHWPDGERDFLAKLPADARVALPGGLLVVEHGDRFPAKTRHARLRRAYPEARAIVCGHSHRLALDRDAVPWVLNPGACGRSRAYGGPGCLLLHATPGSWRVEEFRFDPLPPKRRRRRT